MSATFRRLFVLCAAALIAWLGEHAPIADLSLEEPPIERIVAELYRRGRS